MNQRKTSFRVTQERTSKPVSQFIPVPLCLAVGFLFCCKKRTKLFLLWTRLEAASKRKKNWKGSASQHAVLAMPLRPFLSRNGFLNVSFFFFQKRKTHKTTTASRFTQNYAQSVVFVWVLLGFMALIGLRVQRTTHRLATNLRTFSGNFVLSICCQCTEKFTFFSVWKRVFLLRGVISREERQ